MKKRIAALIATLTIATVAAAGTAGTALTVDVTIGPQDTGWGAPDTSLTPIAGDTDTSLGGTTTHLDDTGWG